MGNCCSGKEMAGDEVQEYVLSHVNPLNYITNEAQIRSPGLVVSHVHLVAIMRLENGGNHWNMYLQTCSGQYVKINVEPGAWPGPFGRGYLARIDVTLRESGGPDDVHCDAVVPARHGVTVSDFLDAILHADSHRYEFTQAGRGCTGWMRDQFLLFVQRGLLEPGHEAQVEEAIAQEWEGGLALRPWPVTRGYYLRDLDGSGHGRRRR